MADTIIIQITPQRRGFNFALDPRSQKLLEDLPGADPSKSNVFIGLDTNEALEDFSFASVETQVVILLTGLSPDGLLEHVEAVEFQRMPSGDTELTIRA
jgi:hypothetical protein